MDRVRYTVTSENWVIGPNGIVLYNDGVESEARDLAAFLNSGEYEEALEGSLDRNDKPPSGSEWEAIKRNLQKTIKGEESS